MKLNLNIKRLESSALFYGSGSLVALNKYLAAKSCKIFILVDENTRSHCLPVLQSSVSSSASWHILEMGTGESAKTMDTMISLWKELTRFHADRSSILINLGGGVITDTGGFTASTFKRGIRYINVPTTLIGQVDAAIGGKTGVNFNGIKNLTGTFALPEAVFIYPDFLNTLDHAHLLAGFAEMLKYGLINDLPLWERLISIPKGNVERINIESEILHCAKIKSRIISRDFTETGYRKILNFGHTIGHALEAHLAHDTGRMITHGHAVAIGMICESFLSSACSALGSSLRDGICSILMNYFLPVFLSPGDRIHILDLIGHDKKNEPDGVNFTLLEVPGRAVFNCRCPPAMIVKSLDFYSSLIS